jgi:hypothetical protein
VLVKSLAVKHPVSLQNIINNPTTKVGYKFGPPEVKTKTLIGYKENCVASPEECAATNQILRKLYELSLSFFGYFFLFHFWFLVILMLKYSTVKICLDYATLPLKSTTKLMYNSSVKHKLFKSVGW